MNRNSTSVYLKKIESSIRAGNATEHTHRSALEALVEAAAAGIRATNEPRRVACGAPDFAISRNTPYGPMPLGYIEAKDVGVSLDKAERSDQMKRYFSALPNLILTDYLEFRWYVAGNHRRTVQLARWHRDRLAVEQGGAEATVALLRDFLGHEPEAINRPHELALRMARLTHLIRDMIVQAFAQDEASELLRGWRSAFAEVLIADLDQPEKTADFADMFAQTLAYGLFAARVMDTSPGFTRQEAQRLIPRSNPLLRRFFIEISGVQMDDEPYAGFVDDLAALLAQADISAILTNFGKRTRQQDPIAHFYETFLAAYDPKLRESRGVYYTPDPVVSYIVQSVDALLVEHFDCPSGVADRTTITVSNPNPSRKV